MMKKENTSVMKAIAICFKPYLKPEEARIYCDLNRTRMAFKFKEYGICKTPSGYYRKADLDRFMAGQPLKKYANHNNR
jgi:hypothetical protein